MAASRCTLGSVARIARTCVLAVGALILLTATPALASNLLYYGGPVVHSAHVILVP